jgi:D-alanyl-D-alanine endopeptidase (penicillin-binding protein 7)
MFVFKFSQKFTDFFFSFGLMFIGIFLLFFFSVTIENRRQNFLFPCSAPRQAVNFVISGKDKFPDSKPVYPLPQNNDVFSITTTAEAVFVVDAQTDKDLFSKNSETVRPLASITKLMTAMVLLDLPINWNSTTQILDSDTDYFSHQIKVGEVYKLGDLWDLALVSSANNAIKALVRNSGVPEEKFVQLMNEKAKDLSLSSMSFSEPTGLSSYNIGNAKDVAKMLRESLKSEKILKSLQKGQYYASPLNGSKPRVVYSTNWLLTDWMPNNFSSGKIVGKTGFINDSGYNFVVRLADNKDHQIIVAVMGAINNEARFAQARDLGEWIFKHYIWPDEEGYVELIR